MAIALHLPRPLKNYLAMLWHQMADSDGNGSNSIKKNSMPSSQEFYQAMKANGGVKEINNLGLRCCICICLFRQAQHLSIYSNMKINKSILFLCYVKHKK